MPSTRLLWITNMANPDPRSGGGLRSLRLVQAASATWPVDVINVGQGLDVPAYLAVSGAASARDLPPDLRSRRGTLAQMLLRRLPVGAVLSCSSQARDEARSAGRAGVIVVLEHGWMLGHLPPTGRVVAVFHNVDSELARLAPAAGLRTLERAWNVWSYRRLERDVSTSSRFLATVVSARDARLLGGHPVVVPNGADLPEVATRRPAVGGVLFVGSMGYLPNREAVRWWAEQVWPGRGLPPLTVVGQGAQHYLEEWCGHPAVEVVGEVDDVAPWLARARVVAVPVWTGSGSRLKVVEALAHHRPVVSTTKGSEGTEAVGGVHVLTADDPESFAAAVRRLLDDDLLADSLVERGAELALLSSWPRIAATFVDAISVLDRSGP